MSVKTALKALFGAVLVTMIIVTVRSSLQVGLFDALPGLLQNPWAVATLYDAYFGFLTFYVWLAYKERGAGRRLLWFVLVMGLGNIATSLYILIQLFRLKPEQPAWEILRREA